jgi:hypothetical protein
MYCIQSFHIANHLAIPMAVQSYFYVAICFFEDSGGSLAFHNEEGSRDYLHVWWGTANAFVFIDEFPEGSLFVLGAKMV